MELSPIQTNKKPWMSKTIIINALMAAAAFYPPALAWMQANMELVVSAFGILNIILRTITKDKISIGD